jgi:hypothetical protein
MRISASTLVPSTLLVCLVASPLVPELSAATVSVSYSGTITSVSTLATAHTGIIAGDTITGSFAYDSTQSGSLTTGIYTFTGSSKIHTMSFKIFNANKVQVFSDSYPAATAFYQALVASSAANKTTLDLVGDTGYKETLGVTGPGPPPGFDITLFNPTNGGGFTPTNLPLPNTTTISNFIKNTGSLKWDPSNEQFTAHLTFSLQTVPEPSTLAMSTLAIVTCTIGFRLRRREPA